MKLINTSLIVLIIFLSCGKILPQEILSPANRLKFGNSLFAERDYLRAVNEFTEYLKTNDNDTVRYKIAYSFFEMQKYTQAADNYKTLLTSISLHDEGGFGIIKSNFFSGDFNFVRNYSLNTPYFSEKYSSYINRLIGLTFFLDNKNIEEPVKLVSVFPAENQTELINLLQRKMKPDYKNPVTAALMSALLPGLGKVYVKEYTDGLIAFAATGLSIFLAVDSFNAGSKFKGWLFTGLSAFFYGGSIYGSASAAQIYNAGIKFNFENDIKVYLNNHNFFLPKEKF